jgi:hypothetical protein
MNGLIKQIRAVIVNSLKQGIHQIQLKILKITSTVSSLLLQ